MPSALITGITGQDGSYLAELLLQKGYRVYGMVRRASTFNCERIRHILDDIEFIDADLLDQMSLLQALRHSHADEVYNLAAMSFVATSFVQPVATGEYTGLSVARMLEALRQVEWSVRFYQASTSEMFGNVQAIPQNELTSFYPRSPYGVAKLYAHWMTVNFRESYSLYACSGILFNHESPRRGLEFVTRKITHAVAQIHLGLLQSFSLGNLEARRDWGFAGDYVEAMWRMLQQDEPSDYVVATGVSHSVRDFVDAAFACVGIEDWSPYVRVEPQLFRPAEVEQLLGDASKAAEQLGWTPTKGFEELVRDMVENDIQQLAQAREALKKGSYAITNPAR
ncbi:GDP-mannose 4,6-dehydratase [Dictyobacter arantiisoli]|uniref:GDP-mannose 4,6-dehydratase n=1 Tax=Dictyobacter arantiisoli TaxID=2014874 RepID=A0A5A5T624_9CHLR|nr:GDP-mannose 4,6-dehydratase [Dictyobacter arantiisoli]GCF06890.1 GDP-mannose 4,6-dehydratase [Dictyobacter arantiisoli]